MTNNYDASPMIFVDENGKPKIYTHRCEQSRIGKPITRKELFVFALELLTDYYRKQGLEINDINQTEGFEYPNLIMTSRSSVSYYVMVQISAYPNKPIVINQDRYEAVKELAKKFKAKPVFASLSFACASSYDGEMKNLSKLVCGSKFLIAFRGLYEV